MISKNNIAVTDGKASGCLYLNGGIKLTYGNITLPECIMIHSDVTDRQQEGENERRMNIRQEMARTYRAYMEGIEENIKE